jgi:hypothetical protein
METQKKKRMKEKRLRGKEVEEKRSSLSKERKLQLWQLECFFFTFGEK